MMMCSDHEV